MHTIISTRHVNVARVPERENGPWGFLIGRNGSVNRFFALGFARLTHRALRLLLRIPRLNASPIQVVAKDEERLQFQLALSRAPTRSHATARCKMSNECLCNETEFETILKMGTACRIWLYPRSLSYGTLAKRSRYDGAKGGLTESSSFMGKLNIHSRANESDRLEVLPTSYMVSLNTAMTIMMN